MTEIDYEDRYEPAPPADRYQLAWRNARARARVLSAELTRRAPLLGEYAEENTKLHQWHDEDRDALTEMRGTVERLRKERDAFRDQRNGVFATNERLLAQVEESGLARIRAENEARTAKRAAAAALSVPADADLRDRIRGVIRDCPALYPDDIADRVLAALSSAYRSLLARLEADRAGHLRAAGQATEEALRIDGAVSASTLRHAAAMAVHAFEGPDAAQAYMQRTEGDPVTAVDADLRDRIEVWPLKRVLAEVQCGSRDWTWEEEWADLDRRHAETGYLAKLEQQIRENGITMPVLIGSDGRLWDGHHRLRIAVRLGIDYVPVEITPSAEPRPRFDVEAGLQRGTGDGPASEPFVPPSAGGLPLAALDSATDGASVLDAWARDPHGRNFLAHALVQLARDGWLLADAGQGFEPVRDREAPEPWDAPDASPGTTDYTLQQQTERTTAPMHAVPLSGANGISSCCGRPPCEFIGERVTRDPALVTCMGRADVTRQADTAGEA